MHRVLLVIGLAACAQAAPVSTSTPAPVDTPRPTVIFTGPNVPTMYKEAAAAVNSTFAHSPAKVSAAVRLAYASVGVPITLDDATGSRIGNADFYRARNFAGKSMAALVMQPSSAAISFDGLGGRLPALMSLTAAISMRSA